MAGNIIAGTEKQLEAIIYDFHARDRASAGTMSDLARLMRDHVPDQSETYKTPPPLNIPWDMTVARERIAPFLAYVEKFVKTTPTVHFELCWRVMQEGYPVFRDIIFEWLDQLDAKNPGFLNTANAIRLADDLQTLAKRRAPISWKEVETDVLPLFHNDHPMIAATSGSSIGQSNMTPIQS